MNGLPEVDSSFGIEYVVEVEFVYPQLDANLLLKAGISFEMREGPKVIGNGFVLDT